MASISMAMSLTNASQKRLQTPNSETFLKPLPVRTSNKAVFFNPKSKARLEVKASSFKEKAITGITAAALTASIVVPEVAEAAVSPSLKNFSLSLVADGVVLIVIVGAIIGIPNFDPVKRS